jgi:hypothetical protein
MREKKKKKKKLGKNKKLNPGKQKKCSRDVIRLQD